MQNGPEIRMVMPMRDRIFDPARALKSCLPKFCPNCGQGLGISSADLRPLENGDGGLDYDVSCMRCGWSGAIAPDYGADWPVREER